MAARAQSLSSLDRTKLEAAFHEHSKGAGHLNFEAFLALCAALQLPVVRASLAEQQETFRSLAASQKADRVVDFEEFFGWVDTSQDATALALKTAFLNEDASLAAGAARAITTLTRPLTGLVAPTFLLLKLKCSNLMLAMYTKAAVVLKAKLKNPTRLFSRRALNPFAQFKNDSGTLFENMRAEWRKHGSRGIARHIMGPYLVNSVVAVSMFQTYSSASLALHTWRLQESETDSSDVHPARLFYCTPLCCEATAGFAAGVVQATLNTPLYNIKLQNLRIQKRQDAGSKAPTGVRAGLEQLYRSRGLPGVFMNWRFVFVQEGCSLAAYFASYEWLRERTVPLVREHLDPSGDRDTAAWMLAAGGAGVVLTAVGIPFENVFEWHVTRRTTTTPHGVLRHFARDVPRQEVRRKILLSGMRKRLPLAPLAGLPLLVYEVMMHTGWAPPLRQQD